MASKKNQPAKNQIHPALAWICVALAAILSYTYAESVIDAIRLSDTSQFDYISGILAAASVLLIFVLGLRLRLRMLSILLMTFLLSCTYLYLRNFAGTSNLLGL